MTDDLTPEQTAALTHWAHIGAPGTSPANGWVPDKLEDFASPASAPWPLAFDADQTRVLLAGHQAMEMEDKWHVVTLPSSDPERATVDFLRSWTLFPVVRLELLLGESGSTVERATWEMNPDRVKQPTEAFARGQFLLVFHEVLKIPTDPIDVG